jgi:Protein kinase domain
MDESRHLGTITPDDFRRIRDVFEAALERPPAARPSFIEQACGGDTVLVGEVERMLAGEAGDHSLLDRQIATSPPPAPHARRLLSSDTIPVGGFTPGTILGARYRIIGLLGRGGMGEVYRADDLKLGQPVALKFLPAALAGDPVRRERFYAEVRITRQLSHPNICRVYDIEEIGTLRFLSMEYIDGEDPQSASFAYGAA